jgi:hypothetical protein
MMVVGWMRGTSKKPRGRGVYVDWGRARERERQRKSESKVSRERQKRVVAGRSRLCRSAAEPPLLARAATVRAVVLVAGAVQRGG